MTHSGDGAPSARPGGREEPRGAGALVKPLPGQDPADLPVPAGPAGAAGRPPAARAGEPGGTAGPHEEPAGAPLPLPQREGNGSTVSVAPAAPAGEVSPAEVAGHPGVAGRRGTAVAAGPRGAATAGPAAPPSGTARPGPAGAGPPAGAEVAARAGTGAMTRAATGTVAPGEARAAAPAGAGLSGSVGTGAGPSGFVGTRAETVAAAGVALDGGSDAVRPGGGAETVGPTGASWQGAASGESSGPGSASGGLRASTGSGPRAASGGASDEAGRSGGVEGVGADGVSCPSRAGAAPEGFPGPGAVSGGLSAPAGSGAGVTSGVFSGPPGHGGPHAADGQEAEAILERARVAVDPALRAAVDSVPGPMRRIARYHFGWEHVDGTPATGSGGKAMRPALVLATVEALGGAQRAAVPAAAAVELVHNFTLLHDDLMDRDATRRHRSTVWAVFGDADAILAGDTLQAVAQRLLAEDPHPAAAAASARLAACVVELCAGQHADTAMERRAPVEVGLDEVLAMAEAKTGALLGCACAMGGLYAGAAPEVVEALDAFGREAGLAFQLIDDVIGIWGDPSRTGKPAGADLMARKKSLPVVAALTSGTPAAAQLAELYGRPYDDGDLEGTVLAVERAGGRDWAQAQAADRMARAMDELSRAVPDPEAAGGLLALAEFVTRRTT